MTRRRALAAGVVGYVVLRLGLMWTAGAPLNHSDTGSYRQGVSLIGGAPRPWLVPLTLAALGEHGMVIFQTVLSAVAFVVLGWAIASTMRTRPTRIASVAGVLLLGLTERVVMWDAMLLSESLAISLTALLLAALIHLDRMPWWAMTVLFGLWVFVRDGHLFVGLLVIAAVAVWSWRHHQWAMVVGMLTMIVWCGAASRNDQFVERYNISASVGYWAGGDNAETLIWFMGHGMPPDAAFLSEPDVVMRARRLYNDPAFSEWADNEGAATYTQWLIEHPQHASMAWVRILDDGGFGDSAIVDGTRWSGIDPVSVPFVWPYEGSWYTLILCSTAALWSLMLARRKQLDGRWWLPGLITASVIPHAFLVYHASPWDLARHGVILTFGLVIAGWWTVALCVDTALSHRQDRDPVGGWADGHDVGAVVVERVDAVESSGVHH